MDRLWKLVRGVGVWLLAVGLLAWVVVLAWPTLTEALARADAPWWLWAVGGLMVLGNLVLTGVLWWLIHLPLPAEPRLGCVRMTGLMAASGLLNMIPGPRLGLVGRSLYLKRVHGILLRDSSLIILCMVVATAVVFPLAVLPLWLGGVLGGLGWGVILLLVAYPASRWVTYLHVPASFSGMYVVLVLRSLEVVVQALRLVVAGRLMGLEVDLRMGLALGVVGMLGRLVALTPNGLGITEAAMAAAGVWLKSLDASSAAALSLIDRAIETVVVMVVGGLSLIPLRTAWREAGGAERLAEETDTGPAA
ncbi:lysylphosphatidylglycerol synthase domain-containing protein [Mucisphaera sp.]|uniref:lysylphosphatidylglycerol synthase domain-containing protein n=1 Tax=Mucisphaera sp. TaxID=2913024 RepID=UPI003D133381